MNIQLSASDKIEIEKIIDRMSEADKELIYEQVKAIVEPMRVNPAESAMSDYLPRHFDYPIISLSQEDSTSQELAHQFVWDYVTRAAKWEYAVEVFKGKHSYQEVA